MQRYFTGNLRPDQEESWKASDGIFILFLDHLFDKNEAAERLIKRKDTEIAEARKSLDKQITALKAEAQELHDKYGKLWDVKAALKVQKNAVISGIVKRYNDLAEECAWEINTQLKQITALKAEVERLREAFREQLRIEPPALGLFGFPFYTWTGHDLRLLEIAKAALKEVADES